MSDGHFADLEQSLHLPAGRVLFKEGEDPRGIYVIHAGRIDFIFCGRNGSQKALRCARAGDIVGLSDAVSKTKHDCTAVTACPARIGFVPIADLNRRLAERPASWLEIAASLSVDIGACWESMRDLGAMR